MVAALLVLIAASPPDAGPGVPTPREMAQLFFMAGELSKALDQARRCMQLEGKKKCEPFYRAIVEYQALVPRNDQLSEAEAKQYLEWDRLVSPNAPARLTVPVIKRYVEAPLEVANQARSRGDAAAAKANAQRVLNVDPKNAEARKIIDELAGR